ESLAAHDSVRQAWRAGLNADQRADESLVRVRFVMQSKRRLGQDDTGKLADQLGIYQRRRDGGVRQGQVFDARHSRNAVVKIEDGFAIWYVKRHFGLVDEDILRYR